MSDGLKVGLKFFSMNQYFHAWRLTENDCGVTRRLLRQAPYDLGNPPLLHGPCVGHRVQFTTHLSSLITRCMAVLYSFIVIDRKQKRSCNKSTKNFVLYDNACWCHKDSEGSYDL